MKRFGIAFLIFAACAGASLAGAQVAPSATRSQMSVTAGARSTKWQMFAYTLLLLPLAVAPYFLGIAGPIYLAGSALLGILFVTSAIAVLRDETYAAARRMFGFSILYLFLMFLLLMVDANGGALARLGV